MISAFSATRLLRNGDKHLWPTAITGLSVQVPWAIGQWPPRLANWYHGAMVLM